MNNKKYNIQRYNRKKQMYRFTFGIQQLLNYPVLNIVWLLYAFGVKAFILGIKRLYENMEVTPILVNVFQGCMNIFMIIFPIICAVGLIQEIGNIFARRDEADMELVFRNKRDVKNQSPILIYKKKDRKSGATKREFYTTIPMKQWKESQEIFCDQMNVHLIGDITYGGRKKNRGNYIYFESAKDRKPKKRGVLYDDIF